MNATVASHDIHRILHAEHDDPFGVLGLHQANDLWVVRAFRPDAKELEVIDRNQPDRRFPSAKVADEGLFEAQLTGVTQPFDYLLRVTTWSGETIEFSDPYSYGPILGELDMHLVVASLLHGQKELHGERHDHEIDERGAEQEQDRRGDKEWQEGLALAAVKPRRHEHVDLRGDDRKRDEDATERRDLELHDEIFEEPGIDEFGIFRAGDPDIRPGENVVDVLGEEEAQDHR